MVKRSKRPSNKKSNAGGRRKQHQQQQAPLISPPTRSSRRLQNISSTANTITPSDNTNNTLSTTNTSPPSSDIQLDDAELRRRGVHPTTNLRLDNCICPDPTECRKLMWRLAAVNDKTVFPYLRLPTSPKVGDTTPTGQHILEFNNNVFKHL